MEQTKHISAIVSKLAPELKKLALDIHDNPEIGGEEFKACQWHTELLRKYGFAIETPFCGLPTAYRAVYKGKKPGPRLAFMAEYDALPELGHGCGHNLVGMVSVGAGVGLREFIDEYGGEVSVIGTPAEEKDGAKVEMTKQGVFDQCDAAMMAHPAYFNAETINTAAINTYRISFYGRNAHAAGAPEEGINALDAVINFFNLVNALRQQTQEDARIHGIISKGGVVPNVIPDHTEVLIYVRANKSAYLEELSEKVLNCARGAALGTGTRVEIENYEVNFKDTCSNMTLSDLCCAQIEKMGLEILRFHGKSMPGSSDVGDVSYACPAIQIGFKVGDAPEGSPFSAHTPHFKECARSDEGIASGLRYVEGFVSAGIELLTNPAHLVAIKEEFARIGK